MKKSLLYIAAAAMLLPAITGCSDDFERPPMIVPEATWEANTSIMQLKEMYWSADRNYVCNIGDLNISGEHIIIKGRVSSSDATGNIYKSVIIQDGTAALTLAINGYDLYQSYHFGQEVVIDVTGMKIGGYNGLMQLGGEGTYNNAPSMTFMESDEMKAHSQLSGLGVPSAVDTTLVTIPELMAAKTTDKGLKTWQSRLIRINGVEWTDPGRPYAEGSSSTNRYIVDADGNQLLVRNSAYADFKDEQLPYGSGDVAGILSYYGTDWQLLLIDADGCMNFDTVATPRFSRNSGVVAEGTEITIVCGTQDAEIYYTLDGTTPDRNAKLYEEPIVVNQDVTIQAIAYKDGLNPSNVASVTYTIGEEVGALPEGDGTAAAPYNATQAKAVAVANGSSSTDNVYVTGYVVSGEISSQYGSGTWEIANTPDDTENTFTLYGTYDTNNSKFTDYNKVKIGDLIVCVGPIYNYNNKTPEMSKGHLVSINGSTGDTPGGDTPGGDTPSTGAGSKDEPFTVAQVVSGAATGSGVWVEGYIVGWIDGQNYDSGCQFNGSASSATNLLLAASDTETNPANCIPVQLPTGTVRSALNLKDNPGNYKKQVKLMGTIETYFRVNGLKSVTDFVIDGKESGGDTPATPGTPAGAGTAADPYNATKAIEVAKANGETSSTDVYTGGYVISGEISTEFGNASFVVADNADGTGGQIEMFRFNDFGGAKFTDTGKIKKGDYIVVCAPLINYKGNKPETSYDKLYSINGKTE